MKSRENPRPARQPLSPQSIAAFRLLASDGKVMPAKRIARLMGIAPSNVYKLMRPLADRRLIFAGRIINNSYCAKQRHVARQDYVRYAGWEFDYLFADAYEERAD